MSGRVVAAAVFVVLSVFPALPSGSAPSSPPGSSAMREGMDANPPYGFLAFCGRVPDACASEKGTGIASLIRVRWGGFAVSRETVVTLTPSRWRELVEVNRMMNTLIRPGTDRQAFGKIEYWTLPLTLDGRTVGDCEDFALEKRRALLLLEWPASALRLAAAHVPGSGRHAVLVVTTDKGDYVLDNLLPNPTAWTDTGYIWESRQTAGDPFRWVTILS